MLKRLAIPMALVVSSINLASADTSMDCATRNREVAIKACSELILQDPRNVRAYINRAVAYAILSDLDRAIADTTRAIELEHFPIM
jgi:tetratricopeptide (TPR) repeat protein